MAQLHRLPASFFVSISYMCWADRRKVMTIKDGNAAIEASWRPPTTDDRRLTIGD
jgi:tartrate dehydratase alpha subunit/fumarate hydratase class I-like protein